MADTSEPEQPAPAPATPWWRRLLALPGWLDRQLRRVPNLARRYPGLLVTMAAVVAIVVLFYGRVNQGVIVPAVAALAGVWIGQSLSARQAREEAARTEQRLVAERRAAFQARTLAEVTEELGRLCEAAEAKEYVDHLIWDKPDRSDLAEVHERLRAHLHAYGESRRRVRVLRERVSDPGIVAAIDEVVRQSRMVIETTPRERLELRKHGKGWEAYWDAPTKLGPAHDAAIAVIGKALQDLGV